MSQSKALRNRDVLQGTCDKLKTPLQNGPPPSAALSTAGRRGELHTPWRTIGLWTGSCRDRLRWRNSSMGVFSKYVETTNEMYCNHLDVIPQMQEHLDLSGRWCRSLTAWNWSCEMTPPRKPPGIIHLQLRPTPWGQLYPLLVMAQQLWNLHSSTLLGVHRKVNNRRGRCTMRESNMDLFGLQGHHDSPLLSLTEWEWP